MGRDDEDRTFREAMLELGLGKRGARSGRADDAGELEALIAGLEAEQRPTTTSGAEVGPPAGRASGTRVDLGTEDRAFLEAMGALAPDAVPDEDLEPAPRERAPTHGTRRRLSRRIKVGTVTEERVLDLHGKTREEALALLRVFVTGARRDGLEVVKVITGRGLHSVGDAVLQRALGGWLRHDLQDAVRDAVKAPPERGGEGATYVFLRAAP